MKKGKHEKGKIKKIESYLILIIIATLFMCIGYAEISDISATISGTVEATAQKGVFIRDITNTTNVNADTENSKINLYTETIMDSKIVLGSTSNSSITYQVSLYNNSEKEHVFIGAITDEFDDKLYSNENIVFEIEGLTEYVTTILPKESLSFTITFKYAPEADLLNNTLTSKLNFRFQEVPILNLSSISQTNKIYPDCTPHEYEFTVSNYNDTEINTVQMSYYFETTINRPLTVKIYNEDGNEITENVLIDGDGNNKIVQTYKLKIIWDNSNPEENINYNSSEYAGENFKCNVILKATPNSEKYLTYTLKKEFDFDISAEPFYFNLNAVSTALSIKNNLSTLEMFVKNYNEDTNYNNFHTIYEISIEGNENFTFSSNNNVTNNIISKTLEGESKIEDSFDIELTADMSKIELTESLSLKVITKSPYVTEIEIPISVNFHTVKVTLNANGGTVEPSSITVYQTKTYADLPTPVWAGHTFNGWYSSTSTNATKYENTSTVTTSSSTQTLYAQWTSHLLADLVSVGDYVNYPVDYSNVATNSSGGYLVSTSSAYTGWRVLSIEGSGDDKYVRLVTAGIPMTYVHYAGSGTGAKSVTALTTNFFSTPINSTSTNYNFRRCGFKNSSGTTITSISALKTLFTNNYTQISSNIPMVQAMTKADLDKVWGTTTKNGEYVKTNNLIAIPSQTSGYYSAYHLATSHKFDDDGLDYLWNVRYAGGVVFTDSEHGIRPVVTLKGTVETTGKSSDVWQLKN